MINTIHSIRFTSIPLSGSVDAHLFSAQLSRGAEPRQRERLTSFFTRNATRNGALSGHGGAL